jgi:hypothetical protein
LANNIGKLAKLRDLPFRHVNERMVPSMALSKELDEGRECLHHSLEVRVCSTMLLNGPCDDIGYNPDTFELERKKELHFEQFNCLVQFMYVVSHKGSALISLPFNVAGFEVLLHGGRY